MDEDDEAISSRIGFDGTNSEMIGLLDLFERVKTLLIPFRFYRMDVQGLVGMPGVGKTILAKKIYQDPKTLSFFEHRAWVTVGRKPQPIKELSQGILAQLYGDETSGEYLTERFEGKKCLVVLDDVWETEVLDSLLSFFPITFSGIIQIFVTTRDQSIIFKSSSQSYSNCADLMRFLNEEESKYLLCHKVFGEEIFPPQLDKAATKIAKKCEGLPLMILTVAAILSKSEERDDPNYWDDVAEERNSVFKDAYDEISKVLFPSYDYLPQYVKMPFLYMGVFPKDYNTPSSKIITMFNAEGWFLHTETKESFEESFWQCLGELCTDKNLVLFKKKSILAYHNRYKTCRLHSSWRYVCRGEAWKNKFYHVLNKLDDGSEDVVKGQRCLSLENNMLFGIKEFCNSVRLNCASSTRSVLLFGPYHQYPVPIDVGFTLLKQLDALQLRFYTFPIEILTLFQLKYLALTCNAELPKTISKLFNLQVLIIHPYMSIRCCRAPSYIPIQIWDMQELEHIEILGKSLVAPHHDACLEKLSTLVGVNASICTILELSKRIPNVRNLRVQIELTPYDDHNNLLSCLGCISTLESLKTLKCSIINPVIKSGYVVPANPSPLMFSCGLEKLHLSGMGFPWEYMDVIGSLPLLRVLKLRSYAFRGSKWEAQSESFMSLEFLLVEDSDLVQWEPSSGSFPRLSRVIFKHCYKLEGLQWPCVLCSGKIKLVNCNPLALTCAKQLQPDSNLYLYVTATSSFEKKPMTIKFERYGS